jgi:hypothetical protein
MDFKRGWAFINEVGKVRNACANCELFSTCDKNPHYSNPMCSDGKYLEELPKNEPMSAK